MTSGVSTNSLTALEIITEACAHIRVGIGGEPLASEDAEDARRTLNLMVKAWQADGLHLWKKDEAVLFPVTGQASYQLGGSSADHCALASDVVQTSLTADAVSGASIITVSSISGIASGDHIGVELADTTLFWTTVSAPPSGSTVHLTATLTGAASSGGVIYSYTTPLLRPARILSARRRIEVSDIDVPIIILERPDYFDLPNKDQSATVTMVYYDPRLTTGLFRVWNPPTIEADTIRFTFESPLEIFTELTDTADLPDEWLEPIAYNLAYRLAPRHSFPLDERALLRADAQATKEKLLGFDREYGSVFFGPDFTQGGGYGENG